jgi:hypothetical protein
MENIHCAIEQAFFSKLIFLVTITGAPIATFFFHLVKFRIVRPIVLEFHHFKGTQSFRCDSNLFKGIIFHNRQASISS